MNALLPDRKVIASGVAGILTWGLMLFAGRYGYHVDPSLTPALVALVGTVIGYVVPPSQKDILKRLDDELVRIAQDDPRIPVSKP